MARHARTHRVGAEISINPNGQIYIGIEAQRKLRVGYNDRVRVVIPREEKMDIEKTGCLNAAKTFGTSKQLYQEFKNESDNGAIHVDAIVEELARTWDDEHGLTENRFDGHDRLGCE